MEKVKIREILINTCKKELEKQLNELKKAMDDAQFEANQHIGAMESRYDSFKEEAQARVSGFARQIDAKKRVFPEPDFPLIKIRSPDFISKERSLKIYSSPSNVFDKLRSRKNKSRKWEMVCISNVSDSLSKKSSF